VSTDLDGLLNEYALAVAPQDETWSPIEQMRREQAANDAARRIADLLSRDRVVESSYVLDAALAELVPAHA
jgi:hypothetical protein